MEGEPPAAHPARASSAAAWVMAGGTYRFRVVAYSAEGLTSAPAATAGALDVPETGP